MAGFFITGTDTGAGKTWATIALMRFLQERGLSVIGMKPVASGCHREDGMPRNEDALRLQENSSIPIAYEKINIYSFVPPASPHIAARLAGQAVSVAAIAEQYRELERQADCILVEGVGGWEVPLNDRERVSDLALALGLPTILVVGMRLGCLNHAFLTHAAIVRTGVEFAGWIANCVETDFPYLDENIATLQAELDAPCLGVIHHSNPRMSDPPKRVGDEGTSPGGREEILRRFPV